MTKSSSRRLAMAALALVGLAGCGGTASLTGTVSAKAKKLTSGTVTAVGGDGVPRQSPIRPDGSYNIQGLPPGPARLTVSSPDPRGPKSAPRRRPKTDLPNMKSHEKAKPEPPTEEATQGWIPISARYALPETSGLTAEVKPGPNTQDLKLD